MCPYCGRMLEENYIFYSTKDHILPKHLYRLIMDAMDGKYSRDEIRRNDPRNIIQCCSLCNREKSGSLCIPDWSVKGMFRYWDLPKLKDYAEYFYMMYDGIVKVLETSIIDVRYKSKLSSSYFSGCKCIMFMEDFRAEYEYRLANNYWYIE